MKREPQYKDLTFATKKKFEKWLNTTTYCIIDLEDCGQDLLRIWAAKTGEILHCNLQGRIWNGKFINMEELEEFVPFGLWIPLTRDWSRFMVPVKKIKYTKNETAQKRQPSHA